MATNTGGAYCTTRHSYKLTFQYTTKLKRVDNVRIPLKVFTFTNPVDCFKDGFESDYLFDIIGVLSGIGREREYEKNGVKTKVLAIELDNNGFRFQITLFGSYVDELNSFIASSESSNAVVAVLFAKCKDFNVKASKLLFNPDISEADALRKRIADNPDTPIMVLSQLRDFPKISEEEDFLSLTKRVTIAELKDYKKEAIFVLHAEVNCIVDEENWWYTACRCNKKLPEAKTPPSVVSALVGKCYLFKVECPLENGSHYEKSYRVKRVWTEPEIIDKFQKKYTFQVSETFKDASICAAIGTTDVGMGSVVAQDLLVKFAEADIEKGKNNATIEVMDLSGDTQESPTFTKSCQFDTPDMANSTEMLLKRKIKIEKD